MDFPKDWKTNKSSIAKPGEKEPLGHQEVGGTICIHSLAVLPAYQHMGIGSVLLRSYIQRIKDAKIADRLALLAHEDMKKFYARFGFDDMGPSQASFGGGGWNNMVSNWPPILLSTLLFCIEKSHSKYGNCHQTKLFMQNLLPNWTCVFL